MSNFNFPVKKQTYAIALKNTKDAFVAGDTETGLDYLEKSISLCKELIAHCSVEQWQRELSIELKKLETIKSNFLEKGINPFAPRAAQERQTGGGQGEKSGEKKPVYFSKESPDVTLADIAGLKEVKKQILLNVITPLKDPDLYYKYKEEAGCQILMYGPPGCGKSFVAEAIAGELKCAYAIVNASDILDKYVGEAPKKIVQIFEEAKSYDNCLIFFDELEVLFASRESDDSTHTKDVLTTFLTCLSGFNSKKSKTNVRVVIGATNRPWALDSALLRGKRFDTHLYVGLPDEEARRFMVKRAFKNSGELLENTDLTVDELVGMFDGYSGADISSMVEKMKSLALERALTKRAQGEQGLEPVTKADAKKVFDGYRNSITPESLCAYEAFRRGEI